MDDPELFGPRALKETAKHPAHHSLDQNTLLTMSPRSRGANRIADALGKAHPPNFARTVLTRSGFSTSNNHVCRSCRQALSQRRHASTATAKATVEAPPITQLSPDGPEASSAPQPIYTVKAGVVVSRPPLITADPHPFETAYYLYQRRLNERLVLPFTQYFYYKRGTPAFEHWRAHRQRRGGAATRDIGKYNAYTPESWNDEALVGDDSGLQTKIVQDLIEEEGRAEEFTGAGDPKFAGLKRRTAADDENNQQSLERSLQRTLYLLVKNKKVKGQSESERWKFPSGTIVGFEGLKEVSLDNHDPYHWITVLIPGKTGCTTHPFQLPGSQHEHLLHWEPPRRPLRL